LGLVAQGRIGQAYSLSDFCFVRHDEKRQAISLSY
jgi:hypothetical protein